MAQDDFPFDPIRIGRRTEEQEAAATPHDGFPFDPIRIGRRAEEQEHDPSDPLRLGRSTIQDIARTRANKERAAELAAKAVATLNSELSAAANFRYSVRGQGNAVDWSGVNGREYYAVRAAMNDLGECMHLDPENEELSRLYSRVSSLMQQYSPPSSYSRSYATSVSTPTPPARASLLSRLGRALHRIVRGS
ncbi:MAG TPA: hypothetical protein VMI56_18110 [Reyranella sp.]|nr:hypothetical protein [Reyranella sp.]